MRMNPILYSFHRLLTTMLILAAASCLVISQVELAVCNTTQLIAIPHPDISELEQVVIEQISQGKKDVISIANNPESNDKLKALTYGKLGHIYQAYEYYEAAYACYFNASELQGDVYRWNYCVAYISQKQGNYEQALKYYKKARSFDVTTDLIYLVNIRIGECYQSLSQLDNAENAYKIAHTLIPNGPTVLARLGELKLAQKQFKKSIDFLNLALRLKPDANKLHYPLAMAYRKTGERELAKKHLDQRGMVGIQPPDPLKKKTDGLLRGFRVHILAGKSAFSAKRYREAAMSFEKAIAHDPKRASGWINLSAAQAKLNNLDDARLSLEEAIRLDPENDTAKFNMGDLLLSLGKNDQAVHYLESFIEVSPNDANAAAKLAKAFRNTNNLEKAIKYYKKSLDLDPNQERTWFELIDIFERIGENKPALGIMELSIKNLPHNKNLLAKYIYTLVASPDPDARDGKKALTLANRLYRSLSNYKTAKLVAMGYAETDQCELAVEWMKRSVDMARTSFLNETTIKTLENNLDYLENNSPCRIP